MSVFLPRKRSSCWPLPRLSGWAPCSFASYLSLQGLGWGVLHLCCRFCSKDTGPLLLCSSVSGLYCTGTAKLKHKSQWEIVMSCAGGQVLPGPHCCTSSAMWAAVRHRRTYHEGDLQEHGLLLAPEGDISGAPALGEVHSRPSSESQGDPWYRSVSSFQELRCRPGVESRYKAQAHHLHTSLP